MTPRLLALRFLTLRVANAARSRRFYAALGLEPARGDTPGLPMLDAGGVTLALATDTALAAHAPPLRGAGGSVGVSLNTHDAAAVEAGYAAGCAAGGHSRRAPHRPSWGGLAAWIEDPDGHRIELVWNPHLGAGPDPGISDT
jgi:uncharacterized protein